MIEANVTNAAEQLTVMDYFFYGREKFTEEELEFVNSKYSPRLHFSCVWTQVLKTFHLGFLDSKPLNNMLDDLIANAIDNYDHPRKHVTYDDRMAHVDVWHSFIDWALFSSPPWDWLWPIESTKVSILYKQKCPWSWNTNKNNVHEIPSPRYDYTQGLRGLDPATRVSCI